MPDSAASGLKEHKVGQTLWLDLPGPTGWQPLRPLDDPEGWLYRRQGVASIAVEAGIGGEPDRRPFESGASLKHQAPAAAAVKQA